MASNQDLYAELQVDPAADPEVIEAAYRRLVKKHHPDLNGGRLEASERMKRLNAAYDVLRDPERRHAYDRVRHPRADVPVPPRPARGRAGSATGIASGVLWSVLVTVLAVVLIRYLRSPYLVLAALAAIAYVYWRARRA